jgi:DNA-binding MarR family transcriptional regulator
MTSATSPGASGLAEPPAEPARPRGCTNFKLRQLLRLVARRYDEQLGRVGLKGTQYSLLSHLVALGPVQPSRLAADMGLDASTLTRNLAVLSALGWVQMAPGGDLRSRRVLITEAGRAKQAEARPHWKAAQQALNERLGEGEVVALHALLDRGYSRLTDATPAGVPGAVPVDEGG